MKKILYISHSPYFNGAEISLLTLVRNINRDKFEPIVVFPSFGPLTKEIDKLGIKTYVTPLERWIRYDFDKPAIGTSIASRSRKVANLIERESIDIVHSNTSVILEGAVAAKMKNVPHVWHIHEVIYNHPNLSSLIPTPLIYQAMSYLSEKIVCVSNFVKRQFENIVDAHKLLIIYNAVEKNRVESNDNVVRKELGISNDDFVIVNVGLLSESKGCFDFLEAAALLRDQNCDIKFVWVGGALKEKTIRDFKSLARKKGIEKSVIYLGFRADIPEILKCSDLYVCPSWSEGFPLAVLEAMEAGLPVISTDCGGTTECILDGVSGFIVSANNPEALSKKISELFHDEQKRKVFAKYGLQRVRDNFSTQKFVTAFESLYELISGQKRLLESEKERVLFDALLKLYQDNASAHWRLTKKTKLMSLFDRITS